jgi:hypothetical protein
MSAETRTIEPVPVAVPAVATVPGKRTAGATGSRVPLVAALAVAAAAIAALVTMVVLKKAPRAAVRVDAAPAVVVVDAGVVPDAAPVVVVPPPLAVDAGVVVDAVSAPPDAGEKTGHGHGDTKRRVGHGTETGTDGWDPCDTDHDGIPDCR